MKKLFLILLLVFIPIRCFGWGAGDGRSFVSYVVEGGGSLFSDDFESYADTDEWSTGDWTEPSPNTQYEADSAVKYAGSLSGKQLNTTKWTKVEVPISHSSSGKIVLSYRMNVDDTSALTSDKPVIYLADVSDDDVVLLTLTNAPGSLQLTDNVTAIGLVNPTSDTWYLIEIEVDLDVTSGIGALRAWIDGTEYIADNAPFDTTNQRNPVTITKLTLSSGLGSAIWFDNVEVTEGAHP